MEETPCDLNNPRFTPYKNNWIPHQNTVYWCNLKLAQKRGLQFYQTRSHAIVLNNTLPADCIEKAVCMKTKEEPFHKENLTPRLRRVVVKANSHSGQQDQQDQDARTSCDQPSGSQSFGETWCKNVDFRISGIPLSAVEPQETHRKDKVKSLIQQFESHPNKESFLLDLSKTEEINTFSEESKKLITDMGNTEIFEFCETSSKKQCPDCNLYWEIGIVYCACGRCLKPSQRTDGVRLRTTTTSCQFLAMLSKRITLVVPNMDLLNGNECTARLRKCCKKLVNPSMEEINPYLERWHKDEQDRKSLSEIRWTEEQIIEYDKIALEDHSYVARRSERIHKYKTLGTQIEPRRCWSKTRMQKIARRRCDKDSTRI